MMRAGCLGVIQGDQPGVASAVVGELLDAASGVSVDIELMFRDVDADSDLIRGW
jgi:hypothetical protein